MFYIAPQNWREDILPGVVYLQTPQPGSRVREGDAVGTSGYQHAKDQLFRLLDDTNPDPKLAALEEYIMSAANTLGIGTMGFGGGVMLIGCKIGAVNRLPASFFVSVAYDCWAFPRLGIIVDAATGMIRRWLYRDDGRRVRHMARGEAFPRTGKEAVLRPPVSESEIRKLKVGDIVLISGEMHTGRDAVHAHLMKNPSPVDLHGARKRTPARDPTPRQLRLPGNRVQPGAPDFLKQVRWRRAYGESATPWLRAAKELFEPKVLP